MSMPRATLTKIILAELAAVPAGAQDAQGVAVLKSKTPKSPTTVEKRSALTSAELGHTHVLYGIDDSMAGTTSYESTYVEGQNRDHYTGHCHPWVRGEDGLLTVGEAMGHTHNVGVMSAALAKANENKSTQGAPVQHGGFTKAKDHTMDPKDEQIASLQKSLTAIRKLSTLEHALWKSLGAAEADAFLAKSDRSPELAEFEKRNAIEYTADDGTIFRKSDDVRLIAMAKRADEAQRRADLSDLKKRATDTLGALAGADDAHVVLLKAVESIKDEKQREAAITTLKAANSAMKSASVAKGVNPGSDPALEAPMTKFNAKLADFAKSKNQTPVDATAAFVETPEGAALYDELLASQQ